MEKSICKSTSPLTMTWMIMLLVAGSALRSAAQVCRPASEGRLVNIIGHYDSIKYPASRFRSDMDMTYFKVWPENISHPRFRFFCQDGSGLSLVNFTATCDETIGRLDPRPYYDVGAADDLQPYYKHWTYSEIIPTTYIQLFCERNDMLRLYSHRIWKKTLIPAVVTTIVTLIILEIAAILCAFLCWWVLKRPRSQGPLSAWFPDLGFEDTVADCVHILLLVIAGFCVIEGVSHSSTMSWRSTCMLDAGVIYTYLTFFALISSFLRQVAAACIMMNADNPTPALSALPSMNTAALAKNEKSVEKEKLEREKLLTGGNDWRWQRVFNQFSVVMLMTAFLSYNENMAGNALDSLVSVIWSVVVVAGTWSIGVSIVFGARAVTLMAGLAGERWCPGYFRFRRIRSSPP